MQPEIYRLYLSPGHNFFGHHGREPDNFPLSLCEAVAVRDCSIALLRRNVITGAQMRIGFVNLSRASALSCGKC